MPDPPVPATVDSDAAAVPAVRHLLDLSGRVALVTGASRGIGAGIATRLAEAGAAVVVGHRDSADGAARVVDHIRADGGRAVACQADLRLTSGAEALVGAGVEAFGLIDIVVNNAGLQPVTPLRTTAAAEWDEVLAVNLRAAFLVTQAAAAQMIAAGRPGAVVNVASIEGLQPAAGHAHYAASKAGLLMHTRSCALELGAHGIRVNAVAPGLIDAPGLRDAWPEGVDRWLAAAPLGRLGQPDDVADACLFLVSAAARWISGAVLHIDGGVMARPTW